MEIGLDRVDRLRFADGAPVRAASAVAPFGDGFVVVQDDATHGAWFSGQSVRAVRLLPPIDGLEVFDDASGTKHLKPDLEAACRLRVSGERGVLALGSGSAAERMRWSLLRLQRGQPQAVVADMSPLYPVVAEALSVELDVLNMEGACVVGGALRWFHRGLPSAGLPSGSVDLELADTVAAVLGHAGPDSVRVRDARHYEFGEVEGIGLAATDAVTLPGGGVLVSAAAEDSPNTRDDGPVVGSALVLLGGDGVEDVSPFPLVDGVVSKVEGLMVLEAGTTHARLLAVVDGDDPEAPSLALRLRARW